MTPNILYSKSKFHYLTVPYPEKLDQSDRLFYTKYQWQIKENQYHEAVAASLASAVEFDEGDQASVKALLWPLVPVNQPLDRWRPLDGQLFTVEGIEVEVEEQCRRSEKYPSDYQENHVWHKTTEWEKGNEFSEFRQVVRLKAKPESGDDDGMAFTDFTADSAPPEPTCGQCGKELTLVRPGKHQCDNPECAQNKAIEPDSEEGTIIQFLLGEKSFNGYWFGEKLENKGPSFWWRKELRAYVDRPHPAPLAKGEWRVVDPENKSEITNGRIRLWAMLDLPHPVVKYPTLAELQAIAVQLNSGEDSGSIANPDSDDIDQVWWNACKRKSNFRAYFQKHFILTRKL